MAQQSCEQCTSRDILPDQDSHLHLVNIEDGRRRRGQDEHTDQTWSIGNKMSWCKRDSQGPGLSKMPDKSEGQRMMDPVQTTIEFCWCRLTQNGEVPIFYLPGHHI